jgi:uncharacterized membrane protein YgcG
MFTTISRFGRTVLVAGWVLSFGTTASAQDKTPLPALANRHVYVAGVPDRYAALADQIKRLERSSPQSYYVVVVKSTGPGASATKDYADELFDTWRSQASRRGLSFDPERSVIIVLAVEKQQVAVRPGATLRSQFGLRANEVEEKLINDAFIPLARADRYPEAIAALLNATNNWIAARDSKTARVPTTGTAASAPRTSTTRQSPRQMTASTWSPALVLGIIVVAVGSIALIWLWIKHSRTKNRIGARIKEIKSQAVVVMDRLDGLKERLKLMPSSPEFNHQMSGQTQALYNDVSGNVGKLWDAWLKVMEVLDKAQKLEARSGSLLSQKTLADAEELINRQGSFQEIENQAQAIATDVDRLDHAHKEAGDIFQAIKTARPKLDQALESVKKLDLPTSPYQEEVAALDAGSTQASSVLGPDPLGTKTVLEQLRSRADTLLSRIEGVASLFQDARQIKTSLETITRQVAAHRGQGLKLVEDGANPDRFLEQVESAHSELITALRAGDPDAGAHKRDDARSLVLQAQATIEKVQKAKVFCEKEQPARVRETERLRSALPQAEAYQNDLERDFARSSWQAVARNLDQARALLATFDRQAQTAAVATTITRQEYVRGAALLEELARQQQIVLRLMSGLGEQLNSLTDVRNECRKFIEQLASSEHQTDQYIRQYDQIVGEVARNSLESARRSRSAVIARSGDARPDWPALRQSLAEAIEDVSIARSQAEEDVKQHEALTREFDQVRQTASRVYALLASHQEDRLAANQLYQTASDALDRIGLSLTAPRGSSAGLLEQLRTAAVDLDHSEQSAREDIRLAAQAQSLIGDAGQAIQQARSYSSMGFMVDTSSAESQMLQAQQLLQTQNYEQAIQYAGAAIQGARQVYYAAIQQMMLQQAAAFAEERRAAARRAAPPWNGVSFGTAAATAAAATILENAASADEAAASDTDSGSPTAVGSWSSDTGQASW